MMGDRANVYVHEGDQPGVYLYSHWGGSTLPQVVRDALARGARWDDGQYLTRIIFDILTTGHTGGTTGFGISARVGDGADRIVDVDTHAQRVTIKGDFDEYEPGETFGFSDFIVNGKTPA
jgi:hypothetical protein